MAVDAQENGADMKAVDANLLTLLNQSRQFVVPIYQRVYSWELDECERLWNDIVQAGSKDELGAHFTGSIVYVEKEQGTRTSSEPDLIIDGQQRVTTVTLILAALAARLEQVPDGEQEPVDGFSPKKIRGQYLRNDLEDGERYYKLVLSKSDREALKAIIRGTPESVEPSRLLKNYEYFVGKLADKRVDLVSVCLGLKKLVVVDVKLTRGVDHPQLVFEAMNSTGRRLSQADLIRNFVLMGLGPVEQTRLYESFWYPMEQLFAGANEWRFDGFVRNFLTLKTGSIPRVGDIYEAFKNYAFDSDDVGHEELVVDLSRHANWYANFALGRERDEQLRAAFLEVDQLGATVVHPLLLRLYADFESGVLSKPELLALVRTITAFVFRRSVCAIPPNVLNKTFASLSRSIDSLRGFESLTARFLTFTGSQRFPKDEEFIESLKTRDIYGMQRVSYLFRKLENHGRKELVSTAEYSIEHIMPQNENVSPEWRAELGEDWQDVHERLLHTLGNLTLTGYNPEYSDRPFVEKRDMEGGFRHSPLRLNEGLGQVERWDESAIAHRAERLASLALLIWARPVMPEEVLSEYRTQFTESKGFDWSTLHDILERMPAGFWTGYFYLAEAVGTSAQPLANHISKCPDCVVPHRVLRWNGEVAPGFAWSDPEDARDPRAVLESEGVRFVNDRADPEQKLTTEQLLALLVVDEVLA